MKCRASSGKSSEMLISEIFQPKSLILSSLWIWFMIILVCRCNNYFVCLSRSEKNILSVYREAEFFLGASRGAILFCVYFGCLFSTQALFGVFI